ncbi:hypothetical protein Q4506_04715 [Colwellia sp. 4_MG-2023]|jgi:hypothetical protein|uniref:hypothetical protein n=1 Tax=unclassified Colwellia TaxID=196834 RepID=UPI002091A3DB|nr:MULTISPECIES: hypothetical protein [unclassified Colwellia]MDO6488062.1 hypothetical protein [Colwellia sp. 6_MG-2023]MDO6506482.1 hypothetical protein [Colwellia sp. 5_MG-2023]MDO6554969.1 hypothetical protein [Colwellia sp. 4_MG-2023]MDO6651852.1 hypothetical protein [Colwellia sp. 3_MG-2023]MDO6665237.1 hypothetical protein [Colwellia sp. 2_MG-2023]
MIDIEKFAALQKASKDSFAKQKQMMKKVMAGQTVICPECQQPLLLSTPKQAKSDKSKQEKLTTDSSIIPGIRCKKGCTDLQLDFA